MTSYEKYAQIRDRQGLTDYKVAKATGNGTATFTNWKNGKYTPKQDKIEAIADFLGVSPEEIIERPKIKVSRLKDVTPELSEAIVNDMNDIIKSITDKAMKELNLSPELLVFSKLISMLNEDGKAKVYGYIQDMLSIDKYKAHEIDPSLITAEQAYEKVFGIQSKQDTPALNITEGTENKNVG